MCCASWEACHGRPPSAREDDRADARVERASPVKLGRHALRDTSDLAEHSSHGDGIVGEIKAPKVRLPSQVAGMPGRGGVSIAGVQAVARVGEHGAGDGEHRDCEPLLDRNSCRA